MHVESEGSQSRQAVKCGHGSRGTRNQGSLCWRGAPGILAVSRSTAISHGLEVMSRESEVRVNG
jgi:hypothetical protein